jgi:uncharacterized protein (DUF1778 family)
MQTEEKQEQLLKAKLVNSQRSLFVVSEMREAAKKLFEL